MRRGPANTLHTLRSFLARQFGVDARALAAFRVALGGLLLADLLLRARHLTAFYTDAGVLPRTLLAEQFPGLSTLSVHTVSGAVWAQATLFTVAGLLALALLVGYRTTLVTVLSWLLLVSLHARNPVVLNAGDSILRRLLFWGAFLPLGSRWSLDALGRATSENAVRRASSAEPDADSTHRVASVASAALLLQVVLVYAVNAVFKLRGDLWRSGEAIRYVFDLDRLTVRLGDALANYPDLLVFLDRIWFGLVLTAVLLVVLRGRARTAFASLFVAAHLGMAATLRLGIFPFVSIVSLLPFLHAGVWDRVETAVERHTASLSERFDRGGWSNAVRTAILTTSGPLAPTHIRRWRGRVGTVVVTGFLVFVLVWNAAALGYAELPDGVSSVADPTEHRWDMFAPEPRQTGGWYVVPAELESGESVDALSGGSVSWDPPPEAAETYPSVRWYGYLVDLTRSPYADLRPRFGEYLCERWSRNHESDLATLTIYFVEQPTRLDAPDPTERVQLHEHTCGSS